MADINTIIQCIDNIRNNPSAANLNTLKDSLNEAFSDSHKAECADVIYTDNKDQMPFGVMVLPLIPAESFREVVIAASEIHIDRYSIELDSRMFDLGLTSSEVAAIMIYNIHYMTYGTTAVERLRGAIDLYFATSGTQLYIKESIQYQKILEFGLIDTLMKFTNCLYLDYAVLNDAYLESIGLEENFTSAISRLFGNQIPGTENTASRYPKLIILDWCFRLYTDVKHQRIPAINQLNRTKELTASVLYQGIVDRAIDALYKIDTDAFVNESYRTDSHQILAEFNMELLNEGKGRSLLSQIKYNGLRGIEDDFYEFMVRARNAETEDEVMYALKQINIRLSILDDYIKNETLSEEDKKRWTDLYMKYVAIRDEIAKKKVYNRKNYGIFFDYNQIDQMYDS